MFNGKTHAALDLLSNNGKGDLLHLDHIIESGADAGLSVKDILMTKHPLGQSASPADIPPRTPPQPHPVVFDRLDASLIRSTALRTTGAAGPSGLDAHAWRRLCTALRPPLHHSAVPSLMQPSAYVPPMLILRPYPLYWQID